MRFTIRYIVETSQEGPEDVDNVSKFAATHKARSTQSTPGLRTCSITSWRSDGFFPVRPGPPGGHVRELPRPVFQTCLAGTPVWLLSGDFLGGLYPTTVATLSRRSVRSSKRASTGGGRGQAFIQA